MRRGAWRLLEDDSGEQEPGTYALYERGMWVATVKTGELEDVGGLLEWAQKRETKRRNQGARRLFMKAMADTKREAKRARKVKL